MPTVPPADAVRHRAPSATDTGAVSFMTAPGNCVYLVTAEALREAVAIAVREAVDRMARETDADADDLITRLEACRLLGVAPSTLWHWEKSGMLVPVKLGRKVMYRRGVVDAMLAPPRPHAAPAQPERRPLRAPLR